MLKAPLEMMWLTPIARRLLVLLLACLPVSVQAEVPEPQFRITSWHVDDGLPSGEVAAITQTADGYLWIGTPVGLARFDGVKFTVFRADEASGLADSRITNLLAAKDGTLWVGTLSGTLARLRGTRFETVSTPLPVDQDLNRAPGSWTWRHSSQLAEDDHGRIWWHIAGKGMAGFHDGEWRRYTEADGLPATIRQLFGDPSRGVWMEGSGKLSRFDGDRWQAVVVPDFRATSIAPASRGGFWAFGSFDTGQEVRRIDSHGLQEPALPVPALEGVGFAGGKLLLEDRRGLLWTDMGRGGLCWLDSQEEWHELENQGALKRPSVTCLMEDRQGNLWAGTAENGVFRIMLQPVSMIPAVEAPDSVFATCTTRDGTVWIGTRSTGIYRRELQGWASVTGEWGSAIPKIANFLEDRHGVLWAATSSGLFRWHGGEFRRAPLPFPARANVLALAEGAAGNLWAGTIGNVVYWHGDEILSYPIGGEIRSLAEDSSGVLWVGTIGNGLFRLITGDPRRLEKVASYPASDATFIWHDGPGTMWVGSWGAGLFRHRAGRFEDITPRSLPSGRLAEIVHAPDGLLWLSSTNGIFCISKAILDAYEPGKSPPLLWRHFSLEQGMTHRYCSGASAIVDGKLWFPNMEEIAVIDPPAAMAGLAPAKPTVESVVADGRELAVTPGEELGVSSATRRLEFRFTALDLTMPEAVLFRHKLEGMDEGWRDAEGTRSAAYSKLPPGNYRFRVMAGGADGQWREAGDALNLLVEPQWWELVWLRWLSALAAVGCLTGGLVWWQSRKARRKLQEMRMARQLDAERSRIARDIHDEMGANLTYITQLSNLARSQAGSGDELDRIHDTSLELTRTMDEIVWAVDPGHDTLDSLINYLSRTASNFLRAAGIRCRLDFPMEIPAVRLTSEVRHNLFLAFKEAIHNLVKHASASEARLALELAEDAFTIVIEDHGGGFPSDPGVVSEGRTLGGHGLPGMAARLQQIGGTLEIASTPGKGTRLAMRVPIRA